jgi:nucleoside-triphosphatase
MIPNYIDRAMPTLRLLITGPPGCGKTTLIKRVAESVTVPYCGFFTAEIRRKGKRVGFEIESFSGNRAVMSHVDIKSRYKVGCYGVDISSIEKIAVPEMRTALSERRLLIIDEIGKMELHSGFFKDLLTEIFSRDLPFVGTILYKGHPFCDRLKRSPGTEVIILEKMNFDSTFANVADKLKELYS